MAYCVVCNTTGDPETDRMLLIEQLLEDYSSSEMITSMEYHCGVCGTIVKHKRDEDFFVILPKGENE